MSNGLLFVLSAPSGCGKTTIVRQVMATLPGLAFSVSHTTRTPRAGEEDGVHYHFVEAAEFLRIRDLEPSGFLEWAEVHDNCYGTSKAEVERIQSGGNDVILDIDVQGAAQVMEQATPVTVFIAPPSLSELERRLRQRGTEDEATIQLRLENAGEEMEHAGLYDYLIVNDDLAEAVESLRSIIIAERCRHRRTLSGGAVVLLGP
ncbi:guanylate kinase [Desulfogranum mediterraneum]|uniref:guanylate kinase n=1 Tax=Desulfogranum mediterraneum TaxID=160661 RepID=UPI000404698B|nr:guanylate kinase [Desulfogranum mediterraneum]